ncbi:uncharacterized abhydrolase domain-containing protein DDB_G0269086 isoform X2 [Bicyclus anynana]|uniref:Uncharacterized abhydrolase domain-containing protein DDB_G0269086 isoform X2 n=1 Tax=Bicyclus anynana TaxID=110368 RepID=A0ABM3LZG3_BICAN|nr:uncharacterized abhydrolase domain-containing protein DDB_G0269086 isoform X2 [Bicyclus anynana]
MMNPNVYRWCAVPQCTNTSKKTPKKLFIQVPRKANIRNAWLTLARRDTSNTGLKSILYFCEDHFDLPNDMENYMRYCVMGAAARIRMKPGCIPNKYECQTDKRKCTSNITKRPAVKKQRMMLKKECEKDLTETTSTKELETIETKPNISSESSGTLSLASSAPAGHKHSPQRAEYNYEYDNKAAAPREQQESASHYDAYIQDVQTAASGGNTAKKGYSQGSGLRTIAVGSANQAKTALGNQQAAAYQAAYVAKNTLAQSAAQSSATAQAALAGKQVILSGLEQQVRDAKVGLQGEEMQLQQAKRAAQAAAQAAQQAMHQVNVIQAALNAAQATSENANEAASQAAGELGAQTAMVGAARQRLQTLQEQLKGVRIDFEATQAAARKAQAAAQQAQANAAEAAAKAAAAGLAAGQQNKDASHEDIKEEEVVIVEEEEHEEEEEDDCEE